MAIHAGALPASISGSPYVSPGHHNDIPYTHIHTHSTDSIFLSSDLQEDITILSV